MLLLSSKTLEERRLPNMEILILLLVSPAIFAQRFRKHVNPNDEPFLPIHPAYQNNPKLSKRGFDKEILTGLRPELFAPSTDARDSYTASYAGNLKDSYFPGYGSSPHSSGPPFSPYFSNGPYGIYSNPYMTNPYVASQYTSGPPGSGSYPGYYSQTPYYYPDYYNQPFPPYSFPPPDHLGPPGPPPNENTSSNRDNFLTKHEKSKSSKPKSKETSNAASNGTGDQYVDGNNRISQSYKDLTAQSNVLKASSPYNQLNHMTDLYFKNLPFPQTTYKVISVGGQPVGPNYPLPSSYARAQILEQAAAVHSLAKSFGHPYQSSGEQTTRGTPSYVPYSSPPGQQISSFVKPDQEKYYSPEPNPMGEIQEERYHPEGLNPLGKTVETHIFGSEERDLPEKETKNQFLTPNQGSSSNMYVDQQPEFVIPQGDKNSETFPQSPGAVSKTVSISKYQSLPYVQKPGTRVTFQQSQSTYIPPGKNTPGLKAADDPLPVQSYDQTSSSRGVSYMNGENYRPVQGHGSSQAFTYHRMNILPFNQGSQQPLKTNLEDVNFGAKQGNKG